jgi:hypothetical protein
MSLGTLGSLGVGLVWGWHFRRQLGDRRAGSWNLICAASATVVLAVTILLLYGPGPLPSVGVASVVSLVVHRLLRRQLSWRYGARAKSNQ